MTSRTYFGLAAAVALAGCTAVPVPPTRPLAADTAGAAQLARSLQDPGLRTFLADNLGREPVGAWDFETLCWVAFYYHPSLELARTQWATAQAVRRTAADRPNPTLSLTPGFAANPASGASPWIPAVNLDYIIQTAGKRERQQDIARADAEVARLAILSAAWQARSDLRRALVDTSAAASRLAALQAQSAVQQAVVKLLEQRLAAGSATTSEVSAARVAHFKIEASLADIRGQAISARTRVAAALGLPVAALEGVEFAPWSGGPSLSGEALAAAQREALQSRADVLAALAHYESTRATLALEAAKQQPDIHLGPGYQFDQGTNKWTLGVSFELPIFHRNEAPIAEALARCNEAAVQFSAIQTQAIAAIDAATTAQAVAAVQVEQAQRQRDEAAAQSRRTQQRLEAGAADQVELQTAKLEVVTADSAIIDAANAVALAAGQLEDALQVPFPHLTALADPAHAQPTRKP